MTEQLSLKGKCTGKERLIEAARMLTEVRPFDDITIEEIITSAKLSRPTFYYHFTGGKDELRAELVHRGLLDQTPSQDTRLAIFEAAVRIFARSGISAATLEDIATEAGVTRGALCWHFHSKDDLLSAILQQYGPHSILHPLIEQIELDLQNGVPLDDETILRRLAGGFYDGFTSQGDFARLAILLIYTHPQAAHILAEKIVKGRKRITDYIQQRQNDGYFCQDIDANLFVQVMAMVFAMRAIGRGLNGLFPLANFSRDEIIDQVVSLLLYGMARRDQPLNDEADVSSR
jgi:TetR/AcrR family transcriptional regulator